MSKIRVLVVDDSPFIRKALLRIFASDNSIEVVGIARDGKEAIQKVQALKPDVITLDVMMPEMNGIEVLKVLMEINPIPVLMLSQFTQDGAELTLKALELGAMDFVDKSSTGFMDFLSLAQEIITKVKTIAGRRPYRVSMEQGESLSSKGKGKIDVVAIGASTGGPPALQSILQALPADIPFGVLIVQHMPHGFTSSLAKRLNGICRVSVAEAEEDSIIKSGRALIAPSGLHMTVKKYSDHARVKLNYEPVNLIHRPSVDILFSSVAKAYADRAMGVLLTGMGSDGAKGLKEIKDKGGATLAQDEATSVIFGMPRVAIEMGAARKVVPLTSMAEEILQMDS